MKLLLPLLFVLPAMASTGSRKMSSLPTLMKTYQREIAFLTAQKSNLSKRMKSLSGEYLEKTSKVKAQIKVNQDKLINLVKQNEVLDQKVLDAERNLESKDEQSSLLETTFSQSGATLDLEIAKNLKTADKVELIFSSVLKSLKNQSKALLLKDSYFNTDGKKVTGDVLKFGHIAKFAKQGNSLGLMIPVGEGRFKMTGETFLVEHLQKEGASLPLFLYESDQKGMEIKKEKTILDTLAAGGSIAYVIAVMGFIALVMVLIRYVLLLRAGKTNESELKSAEENLSSNSLIADSATNRVVSKILKSNKLDREAREDIINESILSEISIIDKFGTMILVMAAVAPLLGLLGTVTGMISTFDIITEFGTGDPKMLSSGISEALITTKLGLIVAIPTLLLGNLLTSKATKIKLSLECEAMKFANLIESKKEMA